MKSYDRTLKELFSNNKYLFRIPNYQRNYVWDKKEIDAFLNDITYCYEENTLGQKYRHFFGQMIFRVQDTDKWDREIVEVVDGQQRLTTTTLMIAAIYRLMLVKTDVTNPLILEVLRKLKNNYILSIPSQGLPQRLLELSKRDKDILIKIADITETKTTEKVNYDCQFDSQKRILNAFDKIYDYLDEYFKDVSVDEYATKNSRICRCYFR